MGGAGNARLPLLVAAIAFFFAVGYAGAPFNRDLTASRAGAPDPSAVMFYRAEDASCALVFQTSEDWYSLGETMRIEAWGRDSLRVRSTYGEFADDNAGLHALTEPLGQDSDGSTRCKIDIASDMSSASIENGNLRAEFTSQGDWTSVMRLTFKRADSGLELLSEYMAMFNHGQSPREFQRAAGGMGGSTCSDLFHITARFTAYDDERIYGLGQHMHGALDQKGFNMELRMDNTEVTIPFYLSSRGYGFLWNNPAFGQFFAGRDRTQWTAQASRQLDYWIGTAPAGSAAPHTDILERYADVTGHAPALPHFATGFWQCKLRYRSQDEVLDAARGYHKRGLPLSVIVVDFFHWPNFGDWMFRPDCFPDPKAMVAELKSMGVELMVSFWPVVNTGSVNYREMRKQRLLVGNQNGDPNRGSVGEYVYDPFNPASRAFVFDKLRKNYLENGIKVFWMDAAEPELQGHAYDHQQLRYHAGGDSQVGNMFPLKNQQTVFDGLTANNVTEIIHLSRSAWAGSQKYGAAVWSGDIDSSFDSLARNIRAGLNMMMSGIQWWTTDVGGFFAKFDVGTPEFSELMVRWYQYGVFCPLFRTHGSRSPGLPDTTCGSSGGTNEIWNFGDQTYTTLSGLINLRESLRPYITEHMKTASKNGTPIMRPLFFEYPTDPAAATVDDEFMFGPDWLVAPIYTAGSLSRQVYFPTGHGWEHYYTRKVYPGGSTHAVEGPVDTFPLFRRVTASRSHDRPLI